MNVKRLLIANLVVLLVLIVAVSFVAWNQFRLDQKYQERWDWVKSEQSLDGKVMDHLLSPSTDPLPTVVSQRLHAPIAP